MWKCERFWGISHGQKTTRPYYRPIGLPLSIDRIGQLTTAGRRVIGQLTTGPQANAGIAKRQRPGEGVGQALKTDIPGRLPCNSPTLCDPDAFGMRDSPNFACLVSSAPRDLIDSGIR